MTGPRLVGTRVPRSPEGIVLVLHGGGGRRRDMMVRPTQLSVLRMIPIAWRIALRGRGRLAVYRLLNTSRGWDTQHTPVDDVGWALRELRERSEVMPPVGLVGHSLGGRAALMAAAQPEVTAVVALNPYLYGQDGHTDLAGRDVLVVHGTADRIASPVVAQRVAEHLRRRTRVAFVRVVGGKHAMLSRWREFDRTAAAFITSALLGTEPRGVLARLGTAESLDI